MQDFRPRQFNLLPDVVKNLMIINGLFFLADYLTKEFLHINLSNLFGLHYIHSQYFEPYQIVTHMFMHSLENPFHIVSNMFVLWMFGSVLENVWGPKRFLFFYLFTGIGAALLHSGITYYEINSLENAVTNFINNPNPIAYKQFAERYFGDSNKINVHDFIHQWSQYPDNANFIRKATGDVNSFLISNINGVTIGASGAVYGVLLAFGMLFPNTLIYLYLLFPIKAKYLISFFIAIEFYSGWLNLTGSITTNIAHFAHLGGMLFGFILVKYWQKNSNRFY